MRRGTWLLRCGVRRNSRALARMRSPPPCRCWCSLGVGTHATVPSSPLQSPQPPPSATATPASAQAPRSRQQHTDLEQRVTRTLRHLPSEPEARNAALDPVLRACARLGDAKVARTIAQALGGPQHVNLWARGYLVEALCAGGAWEEALEHWVAPGAQQGHPSSPELWNMVANALRRHTEARAERAWDGAAGSLGALREARTGVERMERLWDAMVAAAAVSEIGVVCRMRSHALWARAACNHWDRYRREAPLRRQSQLLPEAEAAPRRASFLVESDTLMLPAVVEQHWQLLSTHGVQPSTIFFTNAITLLATRGHATEALQWWERMQASGCDMQLQGNSLATYNALLASSPSAAACKALFEGMAKQGLQPDVYSFNSVLKVLSTQMVQQRHQGGSRRVPDMSPLAAIFGRMQRHMIAPDAHSFAAYQSVFVAYGLIDESRRMLQHMESIGVQPSIVNLNLCVSACVLDHQFDDAMDMLPAFQSFGLEPNHRTIVLLLKCINSTSHRKLVPVDHRRMVRRQLQRVLELMRQHNLQHNEHTLSSTLRAMGDVQLLREALMLVKSTRSLNLSLSTYVTTSLLTACARHPTGRRMLRQYHPLSVFNVLCSLPNRATFHSIILAHAAYVPLQEDRLQGTDMRSTTTTVDYDDVDFVDELYDDELAMMEGDIRSKDESATSLIQAALGVITIMRKQGIEPNVNTYNAVLKVCGSHDDVEAAIHVWDLMKQEGVLPDLVSHNQIIRHLARAQKWKQAFHVLETMEESGVIPDEYTAHTLATACCRFDQFPLAMRVVRSHVEKGRPVWPSTHEVLLVEGLKAGEPALVQDYIDWAKSRGFAIGALHVDALDD